jgi:hypothetical protein
LNTCVLHKKISIILLLFLGFVYKAGATHLMGGEITWECIGSGQYIFHMKVYRDCINASQPNNPGSAFYLLSGGAPGISLTVHGHPTVTSIPMPNIDSVDITPQCYVGGINYDCYNSLNYNGGNTAVCEYIISSNPVNLPGTPGPNGWVFTWSACCRNYTITNLALTFQAINAPENGFTLRAKMFAYNGQNTSPCYDSSPIFLERPSIIICAGSNYTYNPNAYDQDMDSLSYEFAQPLDNLQGAFTNSNPPSIPFNPGFTYDYPLPGPTQNPNNIPLTLNSITGEMSFTCFTQGNYVQVIKVTAYKCGQKVAEVYREIQTVILSCGANQPPNVTAPFINTSSGLFTNYIDTVTAGDLVTFSITGSDNGFLPTGFPQTLNYFAKGGQFGLNYTDPNAGCINLPCATLNPPPPQSTAGTLTFNFNWQTGCEHVATFDECITQSNVHTFTFTFWDDYCPAPSYTVVTATIVVEAIAIIESPQLHCANVLNNGDVELSWEIPQDTAGTFNSYHIYSSSNLNGPYAVIDSIFNYNQSTYTHIGAGCQQAPLYYYIRSRSGCFGKVLTPAKDTLQTLFVTIGAAVGNNYTVSWNALHTPPLASSYPVYKVFKQVDNGPWIQVTSTSNLSYSDSFLNCTASINYRVELQDSLPCISSSNIDSVVFVNNVPPPDLSLDSASVVLVDQLTQLGWTPSVDLDVDRYLILQEINGVLTVIDTVFGYNSSSYLNINSNPGGGPEVYGIAAMDSCDNVGNASFLHHTVYLDYEINGCLGKVDLNWTAYFGFSNISNYLVYVKQDNLPYSLVATIPGSINQFTFTNMNNSSTYCFYVRAMSDISGISASSNEVCFVANVIDLADFTYMNYATVENNFTAELKCYIDTAADIASYVVTRRAIPNGSNDTIGIFLIDTYDEFIRFFDNSAKTQETAYEYKIFIIDACGNLTGESNIGTTIYLQGEAMPGFTNKLFWNFYKAWDGKVAVYNLYSCDNLLKQNPKLVATFDSTGKYFEHDVADITPADGTICYFIEAIEGTGNQYGFLEKSYSNVICLEQEPVLYIPNAFVFGGLSEDFGPKGIYVNMAATYNFSIWNRWGEKIFETSTPRQNWDATYKGSKVPLGVYVYMLDFTSVKGKSINRIGIVTVVE